MPGSRNHLQLKNRARSQMHRNSYFFLDGADFEDIVHVDENRRLSKIKEQSLLEVPVSNRRSTSYSGVFSPAAKTMGRDSMVSLGTNDPFKTGNKHYLNMLRPLLYANGKDPNEALRESDIRELERRLTLLEQEAKRNRDQHKSGLHKKQISIIPEWLERGSRKHKASLGQHLKKISPMRRQPSMSGSPIRMTPEDYDDYRRRKSTVRVGSSAASSPRVPLSDRNHHLVYSNKLINRVRSNDKWLRQLPSQS